MCQVAGGGVKDIEVGMGGGGGGGKGACPPQYFRSNIP